MADSRGLIAHLYCRCSGRESLLKDPDIKDRFTEILEGSSIFSGVTVFGYAIMDTHFHTVVKIPYFGEENERIQLEIRPDRAEILRRYAALYGREKASGKKGKWEGMERGGQGRLVLAEEEQLIARMHDMSQFMKTLKQRVSMSCNRMMERIGGFWAGRFRSVCFQDNSLTILKECAYVEMNPVRARMTGEPGEFLWTPIGAALNNNLFARRCICNLVEHIYGWHDLPFEIALEIYTSIFDKGVVVRQGMSVEQALDAVRSAPSAVRFDPVRVSDDYENGRDIPFTDLLWCWIRCLAYGHTLGNVDFDKTFVRKRSPREDARRCHTLGDGQYVYTAHPIRGPDIEIPPRGPP